MSDPFSQRFAALGTRFRTRASSSAAALRAAHSADDLPEIARLSHILAGSAGMFGYPEVGTAAGEVELVAEAGDRSTLDHLLPTLTRLLDDAAQGR